MTAATITKTKINVVFFLFIEKVNTKLAAHEQVKRARLILDDWTPLNDMLSQTLKLKRSKISEKYEDIIADIYKTE